MHDKPSTAAIFITIIVTLISVMVGLALPALSATPDEIGFVPNGRATYDARVSGSAPAPPTGTSSASPVMSPGPTSTAQGSSSGAGLSATPSTRGRQHTATPQSSTPTKTVTATLVGAAEALPAATATATTVPTETPVAENTPTPVPSPMPAVANTSQIIVVAPGLNARAGPGVSYAIISELRRDDVATAVATNPTRSWVKILLPAGPAWVNAEHVQIVASQDLPIEEAP